MKQFSHWPNKVGRIVLAMFVAWSMSTVSVLAANECMCFCGDAEVGAVKAEESKSANECSQLCSELAGAFDVTTVYVGCFTDESLYPENSNLCWTAEECATYPIQLGTETYNGTWGGQSAYCSTKQVTGEEMGYCYGPLVPVVLNVPILGVTQVGSVGDYINLIYQYAIPTAALFAALMFTIAGFQYMTAGGDKGAVSKAKGRMTSTMTGIILLMSVYAIAYLIDPRLTRFNELRPPLVKEAVMIDDAVTCEALFGYGYCIDGICPSDNASLRSRECGEGGTITGNQDVGEAIVNPPEIGETCLYSGCSDKGKTCVIKGDNSGGACVACNEVSALREQTPGQSVGLQPSEQICKEIARKADLQDDNPDHKYACYFDDDFSAFSESSVGADECVSVYTDGDAYINCNDLETKVAQSDDGCSAYESLNIDSWGIDGMLAGAVEFLGGGSADQIEDFKEIFASVCEQDVCGVADKGKVAQGSCKFVDTTVLEDIGQTLGLSIIGVGENYACAGSVSLTPVGK